MIQNKMGEHMSSHRSFVCIHGREIMEVYFAMLALSAKGKLSATIPLILRMPQRPTLSDLWHAIQHDRTFDTWYWNQV